MPNCEREAFLLRNFDGGNFVKKLSYGIIKGHFTDSAILLLFCKITGSPEIRKEFVRKFN